MHLATYLFPSAALLGTALSTAVESLEALAASSSSNGCGSLVTVGLSDRLFYQTDAEYTESLATYYSGSVSAVKPSCIFRPETTAQVALAVKTLGSAAGKKWAVAVRGGGHAFFPAANNVESGVVIDLSLMNLIRVELCSASPGKPCKATNRNGGVTYVGPGARWGPVYTEVEKYGMAVTGGREGHVGVSGLLLGGGFSYHSGRRGLACDDVLNYEVVLSSGAIVNANSTSNADLFKALKGSSNNLGVVTRYDLDTFPAGTGVYGGISVFTYDKKAAVFAQFIRAISININNPDDEQFVSLSWTPGSPAPSLAVISASVDGNASSTTYAPLEAIPALFSTRGLTTYSALATQIQGTLGSRNVWYTLSFHNTKIMIDKCTMVFEALTRDLADETAGSINLIFVFQPLPKLFAARKGINVLGLDKTLTKDSILFQAEALVSSKEHEDLLTLKLGLAVAVLEAYAKLSRQNTPFRYLNYAHPLQDPISSYGAENVALLKRASAKYDPNGFFQKKVTGGFKL